MKYISIVLIVGLLYPTVPSPAQGLRDSIEQQEAFTILSNKCNVCHLTKNPSKVFTYENMNGFASKINRLVFVWRRMPKGKIIKLSKTEKKVLKNWIKSLKK